MLPEEGGGGGGGGVRRHGQRVEGGNTVKHTITTNIHTTGTAPEMCVIGAEGKGGVSGRSLGILRGGQINVHATLKASEHNSPEKRKGRRKDKCSIGGKIGR